MKEALNWAKAIAQCVLGNWATILVSMLSSIAFAIWTNSEGYPSSMVAFVALGAIAFTTIIARFAVAPMLSQKTPIPLSKEEIAKQRAAEKARKHLKDEEESNARRQAKFERVKRAIQEHLDSAPKQFTGNEDARVYIEGTQHLLSELGLGYPNGWIHHVIDPAAWKQSIEKVKAHLRAKIVNLHISEIRNW